MHPSILLITTWAISDGRMDVRTGRALTRAPRYHLYQSASSLLHLLTPRAVVMQVGQTCSKRLCGMHAGKKMSSPPRDVRWAQ
jgi:hypothetical protein